MDCFEQSKMMEGRISKQQNKINFQKLRNQAFEWVEATRPNLGEKSSKNHINGIIFKYTMDLMLNRKTWKTYQDDINDLLNKVR